MHTVGVIFLIAALAVICMAPVQAIGGDVGYYDITSIPPGASVTIDGEPVGTTPATVPVYSTATPGHTIEVMKAGFEPWSRYFAGNPAAGQHIAVNAYLVPVPVTVMPGGEQGWYRVSSVPSGGTVTFDGRSYGLTPVTIAVSTTGTPGHTITVSRSGYQTWSQYYSGNPVAGQTIEVAATLTPVVSSGSITVNSNPSGASATLDNGYSQLTTPGTFTDVSPGWHTIQVFRAGYQPYTTSVQITAGSTVPVSAQLVLNQQTGSLSVSSNPVGAGLYVDGVYQGLTNQIVGNLATGPHSVTLVKSGYHDFSQSSTVSGARTTYLSATLSPLISPSTGDLTVYSSPSGASVFLNGGYKGETSDAGPLYITGLSPGTYTLVMKKNGYQDYTAATQVSAGTVTPVSGYLPPASGSPAIASAEISSQPAGADILINNQFIGITPLSLDRVPVDPGKTYTVEIRLAGYQPYTVSGSVTAGQNIAINAALAPLTVPTTKAPLSPFTLLFVIAAGAALYGSLRFIRKS